MASAQLGFPTPQPMDMKGHLPTNWQFFKDSWRNYEIAVELVVPLASTVLTVQSHRGCFACNVELDASYKIKQTQHKAGMSEKELHSSTNNWKFSYL